MSRSMFGWDYPPGVNSVPGDEDEGPCEVCGNDVDNCICPECPECGTYGDPGCYLNHGLELTLEQVKGLENLLDSESCDRLSDEQMSKSYLEEVLED